MAKLRMREVACSFTVRPEDLQGALLKLNKLLTKGEKGEDLKAPAVMVVVPETAEWATADEPTLELVARGREVSAVVPIPCREPVGPGQFLLPLENAKRITPRACGERVEIEFFPPDADNPKAQVEVRVNKGNKREAFASSTSRFPVPSAYLLDGKPILPECWPAIHFDARELAQACGSADAAADSDLEGSNYAFGGLRMVPDPDTPLDHVRLVGLDGRRCHAARVAWSLAPDAPWGHPHPPIPMGMSGCVVPSLAWVVLRRVIAFLPLPDPERPTAPPRASVAYGVEGNHCVLRAAGVTIISRIMEGRTGDWLQTLPKGDPDAYWEMTGTGHFVRALKLAATTTDDVMFTAVNMEVRGDSAILWSQAPDVGHGIVDFSAIVDWDVEFHHPIEGVLPVAADVGFMPSFVVDALNSFGYGEVFRLEIHQEAGSVLLKSDRLTCMVKTYAPTEIREFADATFLTPEQSAGAAQTGDLF